MFLPRHIAHALFVSASLCAIPAYAQETAAVPPGTADPNEIVVTATRQEQPLSRVPISVSAFSQKTLDSKGVKSLADVARFTPGIQVTNGTNQIAIRGISSNAGAGTTGIYIDDTPIQIRNLGFNSDDSQPAIFDLDRVEVLRGPQGTLFGAGSEGGTVRYITPQPGLDKYTAYARTEISSTQHGGMSYEGGVAIGGPIIQDKLGFRVSAWRRHDSGWIDKTDYYGNVLKKNTNSDNVTVLRGALTWQPTPDFTITPSIHYQQRTVNDDDYYVEGQSNPSHGVFKDSSPEYRRNPDRFILPSLKIDYDFGGVKFISNTSYFNRRNISGYDGTVYDLSYYQTLTLDPLCSDDNCATPPVLLKPQGIDPSVAYYLSPSVVTNKQRIFTQEARLQSTDPNSPITWVAGLFYSKQRQLSSEELVDPKGNQLFEQLFVMSLEEYFGEAAENGGPIPLYNGKDSYINRSVSHEKQIAVFADVTWHITDQLSVTGGARYAKLDYSFSNFADGPQNYGFTSASGSTSSKPFTPKANVSFQIDRDNLLYATYAKGFRPGGANAPIPFAACSDDFDGLGITGAPASFKSDSVNSFEVGSKNKLFDRKLSLEASVFNIKWKGIQQFVNLNQCAIRYIDNLGQARARGFDLQLNARPIEGVTIDAAFGYTDAKFTQTAAYASPTSILAVKGDSLGGAPWTASIGVQYDFEAFGQNAYVRGDYQYASKERRIKERDPNAIASYDPALVASAATNFVSLRWGATVGGADVSLFVDNLFDSAPLIDRTHSGSDTLLFTNNTWRPRTFGLTAAYRM
jgi:outer membrane receptor protein involved in Fe transport